MPKGWTIEGGCQLRLDPTDKREKGGNVRGKAEDGSNTESIEQCHSFVVLSNLSDRL